MTDADEADRPTLAARVEAGDDSVATDLSIAVVRPYSTEAPPVVAVSVENVWTRTREFHFEYTPPFAPLAGHGTGGTERLHLVPLGGRVRDGEDGWSGESPWSHLVPDAPEDGCWRVTGSYSRTRYEAGAVWSAAPKESVTREYAVLDVRDVRGCFPSGAYRFDAGWSEETPEGSTVDRTAVLEIHVGR